MNRIKLLSFAVSILLLSASIVYAQVFLFKLGAPGAGDGEFARPHGIAIDSLDNVYVADSGNFRVQKFTEDGTFIKEWGSLGSGDGQFGGPDGPLGIDIDSADNVYVGDQDNNRIQKFTSDGTFLRKWGTFGTGPGQFQQVKGVTVDSANNVYVTGRSNRIQKFTNDGDFIAQWGPTVNDGSDLSGPEGIGTDSFGNVYVANFLGNCVQKFTSNGVFITEWGTFGSGDGQFSGSEGLAVDAFDNIYVVDNNNNRVQLFTSDGMFITKWGSSGTGDGEFIAPRRLEVNSSGNVYVSEIGNNRIQVFSLRSLKIQNPDNGNWYQRFDNTMTWHDAMQYCESIGGHLATITSESEHLFVYNNLASLTPQGVWLGATDESQEGIWEWVTDETWNYTNWADGEPNNLSGIEHYLQYFTEGARAGFWNDLGEGNQGGCGGNGGCADEWYPISTICEWDNVIEVVIDIKPFIYPNIIYNNSMGIVPVAILTTDDFDAYDVDPKSCEFEGAFPIFWNMIDLGKDRDFDMILYFKKKELDLDENSTEASMACETRDGLQVTGSDSVKIVPKYDWNFNKLKE